MSAFLTYRALLVELQEMIRAGAGDTPAAEDLADRMDAPWYAMSDEEQDACGDFAADRAERDE